MMFDVTINSDYALPDHHPTSSCHSSLLAYTDLTLYRREAYSSVLVGRSTRGIATTTRSEANKLGRQAGGKGFGHGQQYRSDREERTPLRIDVGNMIRTGEKEMINDSKHERAGHG